MEPRAELLALGQALRRARENRGWSQAQLAAEAGVTDQTIMRTELGRHAISVDRLFDIAAALGTPLSQLFATVELDGDADN